MGEIPSKGFRKDGKPRKGRKRDPEYNVRDRLFAEACSKCSRQRRCSFKDTSDGPENVCVVLVEYGTYNCESCLRYKKYGGCIFRCCFFKPIKSKFLTR